MPKADLHLHLDGSLRPQGLIEMAQRSGIELPSYTVAGLYDLVLKSLIRILANTSMGFSIPVRCCAIWKT